MDIGLRKLAGISCMLVISLVANAQTDSATVRRDPYRIVLAVGGGVSYYVPSVGVPSGLEQVATRRFGVPATFRAMWYPDHRLRVGVETGRTMLYAYRGTVTGERAQVRVSAVPILLVFSMPLAWLSEATSGGIERGLARRLALTGGTGVYLLHSRLVYAGEVRSKQVSLGWMAAGSYTQPISQRVRLTTEFKWYNATATNDAVFALQLQVAWRAFSW